MAETNRNPTLEGKIVELERRLRILESSPQLANSSITDEAGNVVVNLSAAGLVITTGSITVGGGPVRALDIDWAETDAANVSLTTSEQFFASTVLTVPSWATTAIVFGWTVFQMTNSSGGTQRQAYRTEIDGIPSSGAWNNDVANGLVGNVTDMTSREITSPGSTITVRAMARVTSGTNSANYIRTKALAFYLR